MNEPTDPTLLADALRWDLKGPCDDCPFRRDAPDHEGVAAHMVRYSAAIDAGTFSHSCHKTDNRADGPKNHTGPVQHCGGALIFMVKSGNDLQLPLLKAAEAGKLDLEALTARAKADRGVFATHYEMLLYYLGMARRILNKRNEGDQ